MMKSGRKKIQGFTIAELQVSLFISMLTLVASILLYIAYWHIFAMSNTYLDLFSNSRIAMEWIARDIRWASQVETSSGIYTTSDHCIVLKVPSIDANGSTIASHYDHIIYQLNGSDLYRIVLKDASSSRENANSAIAHYCTSLTFSSGGVTLSNVANLSTVNTVAIFLPLNKTMLSLSGGGQESASMTPTTIVRLRNK
jgi:Tfp pilus assembly protein PilW